MMQSSKTTTLTLPTTCIEIHSAITHSLTTPTSISTTNAGNATFNTNITPTTAANTTGTAAH